MPTPALMRRDPSGDTRGIVLMLHGGAKTGTNPVTGRSLSLRRTTAMADTLAPHVLGEGLSVWLLRFGVRGWNAGPGMERASPPPSRTPGGHSTRLPRSTRECRSSCSATRWARGPPYTSPTTRASSASSPWRRGWSASDPVRKLAGKHLIAGHGRQDRITSAAMTRAFVDQARPIAASAEYVDLGRSGHYMLRRTGRLEPVRPAIGTHRVRSHSRSGMTRRRGMVDAGNVFNHFAGRHHR